MTGYEVAGMVEAMLSDGGGSVSGTSGSSVTSVGEDHEDSVDVTGDEIFVEVGDESEIRSRVHEFSGENKLKTYEIRHKFMPKELKDFKSEITIIDRSKTGEAGQGLDFVQEEFLKKGMAAVKMGKIVGFDVFQEGIRSSYHSDHHNPTRRGKRFFKWELEVKSSCLILMKNENFIRVGEMKDLGELDDDLLQIEEKGLSNLQHFYSNYVSGSESWT